MRQRTCFKLPVYFLQRTHVLALETSEHSNSFAFLVGPNLPPTLPNMKPATNLSLWF
jgi:hypothetical protein